MCMFRVYECAHACGLERERERERERENLSREQDGDGRRGSESKSRSESELSVCVRARSSECPHPSMHLFVHGSGALVKSLRCNLRCAGWSQNGQHVSRGLACACAACSEECATWAALALSPPRL